MKVQDAYAKWANSYDTDRNRTRDLDQQIMHEFLGARNLGVVLEFGCGTGKNTVFLAEIADRVHALDFSEPMIARARQKISAVNVMFQLADISQPWPHAEATIDLVTCNLVLEHVADLDFVFAEAARVLAPRGKLLVSELHPFRQYLGVKANFTRGEERTEIPAFVHHVGDFLESAQANALQLLRLKESWHSEDDQNQPPRLISFLFTKPAK